VVAAVVLAAGAASRYGSPKQQRFLPEVLRRVRAGTVDEIVVVAGAHALDAAARVVDCPEWRRGPGASLRCGLAALSHDVEAAVVVLADGPQLDARAIDRVVDAWRGGAGDRLAATYDGRTRSHPVLLARSVWGDVPDEGARALDVTLVDCADLGEPGDVDVPSEV
jgi:CTP:molybdopterin cytidylyltransferase MocA